MLLGTNEVMCRLRDAAHFSTHVQTSLIYSPADVVFCMLLIMNTSAGFPLASL